MYCIIYTLDIKSMLSSIVAEKFNERCRIRMLKSDAGWFNISPRYALLRSHLSKIYSHIMCYRSHKRMVRSRLSQWSILC